MTLEERNEKLDAAKTLVLRGWTQGASARNAEGQAVTARDSTAVCWCINGAVVRVCTAQSKEDLYALTNALSYAAGALKLDKNYITYNDFPGRTKYEVAALFDHAKEQPL